MTRTAPATKPPKDLHATVTASLIAAIEANPGEWVMPWRCAGRSLQLPANAVSRKPYHGINTVVLWTAAVQNGFSSPLWATYKQWAEREIQVQRGETGTPVIFYKNFKVAPDPSDPDDDGGRRVARSSVVFNADQTDWVRPATEPAAAPLSPEVSGLAAAEALIAATRARIRYGGDRAFYAPSSDHIQMPPAEAFTGTATMSAAEAVVATKLHEISHWSGASHRLAREFGKRFGDAAYSAEELVAEIATVMLMAELGISADPRPDHAQYLAHWLGMLKQDKRAIFTAAARAQEAVEFLKSFSAEERLADAPEDRAAA